MFVKIMNISHEEITTCCHRRQHVLL